MVSLTWLLDKPEFTLDISSTTGIFGGGMALSAMAAVHVYENRRWLGWYNSPGSCQIAERLGRIPSSGFFDGFFSSVSTDLAMLLNLDGGKGPKFRAAHSGTVIEKTGHLASLFMKECVSLEGRSVEGRITQPVGVTVVDLDYVPPPQVNLKLLSLGSLVFSSIPIFVSLGTCAVCGVFRDWYGFATILSGILANGITCFVIGGAEFTFTPPISPKGFLAGDGILTSNTEIILLKGTEDAVNCVTRGDFSLDFSSKPKYQDIGWCSVLFTIQFIAQLFLIPQASFFGQIMFIASLAVSWIYNSWLSFLNKKLRRKILLENVLGKPVLTKFILGTRTTMVVFILLVLQIAEPSRLLDELLPNDTSVWRHWKESIVQRLVSRKELEFTHSDWDLEGLTDREQLFLETLYKDAQAAYYAYAYTYMEVRKLDKAISERITALSQDPSSPENMAKRSRAYAEQGRWGDALEDANKLIEHDSSSPLGYERKHAALLGLRRLDDAMDAFQTMVSKLSESSDPSTRERSRYHVQEQTKKEIRASIRNIVRHSPLVLIDTSSGRLCNKSEQADAFESTQAFKNLVTSMAMPIDRAQIEQDVGNFYRYAMFSHTWEGSEPLYETIMKTTVYSPKAPSTHKKLQMFCSIAKDAGFTWAWSDTCCINKADQFTLQEALVSMFKWYEGSALTIIYLCDVDELAKLGALMMSLWNSRGWTLQEYHASKVVRIYTRAWKPYLGLTIPNHKESPEIISEMEQATGISAQALMALRPGLNDIREKLRLASTRHTTRVEDAAYSLLGIFSMTLPATYGEGDKALGRLLSQLLTNSGDASILAWTGMPSTFNSCLPANISAFSQSLGLHIPSAVPFTTGLDASLLDFNLITRLYDALDTLPLPSFLIQRMKLPCIVFKIGTIKPFRKGSEVVFRARAGGLGVVEIKARCNIGQADSLYLVHPWIDFLLDRHTAKKDETSELGELPSLDSLPELPSVLDADPLDAKSPSAVPRMNEQILIEFLARLWQPFGALLLSPTQPSVPVFKRIAAENVITCQVEEITSATLSRLIENVRVLDVL